MPPTLEWLAVEASAAVLDEHGEGRSFVVSYGGEAFTAGFLIGVHVREKRRLDATLLTAAVDAVQERGRHAVIADHCDLASVARWRPSTRTRSSSRWRSPRRSVKPCARR